MYLTEQTCKLTVSILWVPAWAVPCSSCMAMIHTLSLLTLGLSKRFLLFSVNILPLRLLFGQVLELRDAHWLRLVSAKLPFSERILKALLVREIALEVQPHQPEERLCSTLGRQRRPHNQIVKVHVLRKVRFRHLRRVGG